MAMHPPACHAVEPHRDATRHLCAVDPKLAGVIGRVGPCHLPKRRGRFAALARAILYQQLSTKAAATIHRRLRAELGGGHLTPTKILATSDARLRSAGLSRQKVGYLRDLAARVHGSDVRLDRLHRLDDEAIIEELMRIRGIGRWTAEMFLMFVLNRPDVLPVDDLGIQKGFQRVYRMRHLPKRDRMLRLAEPWRPYRTVASWYLWRSLDVVPMS